MSRPYPPVLADQRAQQAFRATLLDLPFLYDGDLDASETTEVLEVTDLDRAIERAESAIRARARKAPPKDRFDTPLTDDCVGPAVHVPYRPTPVPPPPTRTAPIIVLDEDAFYHPAGRIRGFADMTLADEERRVRERRRRLSLFVLAFLTPFALLAIFVLCAGIGRAASNEEIDEAMQVAAPTRGAVRPSDFLPTRGAVRPSDSLKAEPSIPVVDVKSLKNATSE